VQKEESVVPVVLMVSCACSGGLCYRASVRDDCRAAVVNSNAVGPLMASTFQGPVMISGSRLWRIVGLVGSSPFPVLLSSSL